MTSVTDSLDQYIKAIKGKHDVFTKEANRLTILLDEIHEDKYNDEYMCLLAMRDSLSRIKLLLENSFEKLQTLSVVAVSRYLLEMSIWLKLFDNDKKYGLLYLYFLLENQYHYWNDLKVQLEKEVKFMRVFAKKQGDISDLELSRIRGMTSGVNEEKSIAEFKDKVFLEVDSEAARHFSIYSESAKIYGYDYQAYLIENKAMIDVADSLRDIEKQKDDFRIFAEPRIKDLIPKNKKINWFNLADKVNMKGEYRYIYSFASRHLHAMPSSITTFHQELKDDEIYVFIKYVDVKLSDIVELAKSY